MIDLDLSTFELTNAQCGVVFYGVSLKGTCLIFGQHRRHSFMAGIEPGSSIAPVSRMARRISSSSRQ